VAVVGGRQALLLAEVVEAVEPQIPNPALLVVATQVVVEGEQEAAQPIAAGLVVLEL
jgi:hypothetical protein